MTLARTSLPEGVELLTLGTGAKLHFLPAHDTIGTTEADHPVIRITGLRNPCPQIERFRKGLQENFVVRDADRRIVGRKAGIMSTVEFGGQVSRGMKIVVEKPQKYENLHCV